MRPDSSRGDHVLVIGCGFIGGHIAAGLAGAGLAVQVLSHSFPPELSQTFSRDQLITGDARDLTALKPALAGVTEVIYCVGGLQPGSAELEPDRDADAVLSPLGRVLGALQERPQTALTFLSSGGTVYGDARRPVDEDQPLCPTGAYGKVRTQAELMVKAACAHTQLHARILRCSNVYGERQPLTRGQGAVGVFLDRISRGEPIELFGDGSHRRDFVYVGDVVEVIGRLLRLDGTPLIVNVGSGVGTSIRELVSLIEAACGRPATILSRPARSFDVQQNILDIGRLCRLLSFRPLSIHAGIARLLQSADRLRPAALTSDSPARLAAGC